jgi:glycosyltransferase involved in cell wall biosynthesis
MRIVRYYPRAVVGDGGMTGAVRRWCRELTEAGADVTIAYDRGEAAGDDGLVRLVKVEHRGPRRLRAPRSLKEIFAAADLVVLHSGWTLNNIRAGQVARSLGVPYLLEPRGAYDPHIVARKRALKKAWWAAAERKLVMGARAIHVFFDQERAHLRAIGYHGRVVVAPNGGDPYEGPSRNGDGDGYLLWLGRFDPYHKGIDLFLHGLRLAALSTPVEVRLHGPDWRRKKSRIRRSVAELGLSDRVVVGEPVYGDAKRELLRKARGFVYPSRWDACPNAVLEAAGMGLPVLCTPYPLGQYLAARGGAVLSGPSPIDLAEGVSRMIEPGAEAIGRRAAEVVREDFAWRVVAKSWLEQVEAAL